MPVVTRNHIGRREIGKTDATNIQDLLTEELPGLEFRIRDESGNVAQYEERFSAETPYFLVDGERLAGGKRWTMSTTTDSILRNVGKVEIVKGRHRLCGAQCT